MAMDGLEESQTVWLVQREESPKMQRSLGAPCSGSWRIPIPICSSATGPWPPGGAKGRDAPVKERPTGTITPQMKVVLDFLAEYRKMGEGDLQELLNMKRTCTYLRARQMMEQRLIEGRGRGLLNSSFA